MLVMGLIKTKDVLVRFVIINFLVVDFYAGRTDLVSAAVHHQAPLSMSSSVREETILGSSSAINDDIDVLLNQFKSELARGIPTTAIKSEPTSLSYNTIQSWPYPLYRGVIVRATNLKESLIACAPIYFQSTIIAHLTSIIRVFGASFMEIIYRKLEVGDLGR